MQTRERRRKNKSLSQKDSIRQLAEADLLTFARLVNPNRVYGQVHEDVFRWMTRPEAKKNQLVLLPRGHQKSHMMAVWCAWHITRHPETTIAYISATVGLAKKQLYAIKSILASKIYTYYWPEMLHKDEGKRKSWSSIEIIVDHPARELENVRDPTIIVSGLTTNTTGSHADVLVYDDVVVPRNAYTAEGREMVAAACSQFASVKNAGGIVKAVGTRYHPKDQYQVFKDQKKKLFNEDFVQIGYEDVWEVFERKVEEDGVFLWPRTYREDGQAFGFDWNELASIEAEYEDRTQFFAQYYNDPNDPESARIERNKFQYYDQRFLKQREGRWYYKETPLNVYAAIDFAYEINAVNDYSAIVVIGMDPDGHVYVLDIDRFKTDKLSEYFRHVKALHVKWNFKKLRAEVTAAQSMLVRDLKDSITKDGLRISIDEHRPTRWGGTKEERMAAVLEHRYDNQTVWHYKGGYISLLEDELVLARPPHDDIKDAMASAVEIAQPPKGLKRRKRNNVLQFNSRFGGVSI